MKRITKNIINISIIGLMLLLIVGPIFASQPPEMQNNAQMQEQQMGQQSNIEYSAEKTINSNADEENGDYSSNTENKLAVLVTDKITANLKKFNLTKSGSVTSGGDNTSFYGTNAGILAKSGAVLNIENANINTDAKGANGVFSFGGSMQNNSDNTDGTHVTVKDTTINTKQDDSGTSEFSAKDSEITTIKGDSFYVTNTKAIINLENNTIVNKDTSGNLLRVQKDSWGNEGSNGGDVSFNLNNQKASGNIVVDDISNLEMKISNGSYWEGSINGNNISLNLDNNSKIKLNGDCHIKSLTTASGDYSNIDFNGYKLYVDGSAIN